MSQQSTEIEVEVVEIDGVAPVATPQHDPGTAKTRGEWQDWRHWQGRVRRLDSRWWPLWVFLGMIALALFLTVGVVIGVIFLIFRLISNLIRAIVS